jgi:hypothetical protein
MPVFSVEDHALSRDDSAHEKRSFGVRRLAAAFLCRALAPGNTDRDMESVTALENSESPLITEQQVGPASRTENKAGASSRTLPNDRCAQIGRCSDMPGHAGQAGFGIRLIAG